MPNDHPSIEGVNFPLPPAVPIEARVTVTEERSRDLLHLLTATSSDVNLLKEQVKTLETFHHWASTQIFIQFEERLSSLDHRLTVMEKLFLESLPKLLSNHQPPPH